MDTEPSALLNTPPAPLWLRLLNALRKPSLLLIIALLLFGWQWLETRWHLAELQQELSESSARGQESRALAKHNQEMLQGLNAKVAVLESRQADAQSQQATLEGMYQELARTRDERLLAEIEQTLAIAAQQLQLTGNVEAVVLTLQGVDARLARAGQTRLLPLRKVVNREIDKLRALPLGDIPGIALKLEAVISTVDSLPLVAEQRPRVEPAAKPKRPANAANTAVKPAAGIFGNAFWQNLGADLWAEVRQLIRVERIDHPEPALLAPSQAFFLRENLKLRLIDARLALLQRDGRTYREDLRQARAMLERYFDIREKSASNALATLKGLTLAEASLELPSLADTLASIRNFKLAPEKADQPITPRQRSGAGTSAPAEVAR